MHFLSRDFQPYRLQSKMLLTARSKAGDRAVETKIELKQPVQIQILAK